MMTDEKKCPYGGDMANDCAGCVYAGDFHYEGGECVARPDDSILFRKTCVGVRELAEFAVQFIELENPLSSVFPVVDFGTPEGEVSDDLCEVKSNTSGWFGLRVVQTGFDSDCLFLVSDYYGGGYAQLMQFYPGIERKDAVDVIERAIRDTVQANEENADGLWYVEAEFDEQTNEKLRALWHQFADIPMNPETEEMEMPFMHFGPGTNREEIWHWFDERYIGGLYNLLYGEE